MDRCIPLKQSSPGAYVQVKLPPVKWINFNMHDSHFFGAIQCSDVWSSTWKAILLASGVPHDGITGPARFMLSEHDDYALAVLLRTTIDADYFVRGYQKFMCGDDPEELMYGITGKSILSCILKAWEEEEEAIQIIYPCELSKEEVAKFTVRGEPLEVIEHKVETETETGDKAETDSDSELLSAIKNIFLRLNDSSTS